MTENGKQCYRCKNFDRLYVKGAKRFEMTKFGVCCANGKNVGIHDVCEKYAVKPRGKSNRILLPHCLSEMLAELTAIREIVEAEERESDEM